jgi:hypothetical protein
VNTASEGQKHLALALFNFPVIFGTQLVGGLGELE